jgi:hypothetical protein
MAGVEDQWRRRGVLSAEIKGSAEVGYRAFSMGGRRGEGRHASAAMEENRRRVVEWRRRSGGAQCYGGGAARHAGKRRGSGDAVAAVEERWRRVGCDGGVA